MCVLGLFQVNNMEEQISSLNLQLKKTSEENEIKQVAVDDMKVCIVGAVVCYFIISIKIEGGFWRT